MVNVHSADICLYAPIKAIASRVGVIITRRLIHLRTIEDRRDLATISHVKKAADSISCCVPNRIRTKGGGILCLSDERTPLGRIRAGGCIVPKQGLLSMLH